MIPLPIDSCLPELIASLRSARSIVLVAPPGAGKTTRVPPAVLAAGLLPADAPNLVMLQPRRVAARASAARIAEENGWALGREVGYHIRFERNMGVDTRLRVLTEGILTRQLLDDPFLEGVGAVVLDEFHGRSLHTDLCVAFLREIQQTVREDLILIVMSATLDAEPVSRFLGGCPIVRSEGRAFPVTVRHAGWSQAWIPDRAADAVLEVLGTFGADPASDPGDILVFLPGVEEIRRTLARLETIAAARGLLLLPLHGSLTAEDQALALRPARRRKIICATNIAETSLTIDGVRTVIDSGFARVASYDPHRGLDRLDLERISKASATQRTGRAGRTAPGHCIRLWSASEERAMPDFQEPEVRRVDLCGTVLLLHAWGKTDARNFGWYEPPPESTLAAAERLLAMLGALTAERGGEITPLGHRLLAAPVHPRLARLLFSAASLGLNADAASVAALLSEKDLAWSAPSERGGPRQARTLGDSDLVARLDLLATAERQRFAPHLRDEGIDPAAARQVAKVRDDLLRIVGRMERTRAAPGRLSGPADRDEALRKLALVAYPDRACRRRASDPAAAVMVGGVGVRLAPESIVRNAEFFLALDARGDERSAAREALVRIASAIEPQWLEELFPEAIRRERAAVFDVERGRVVGRSATYYRDLLLREDASAPVDPREAADVLAKAAKPACDWFSKDPAAANVLARLELLRRAMPEQAWPTFGEAELMELLTEACQGKRSLEELFRAPLAPLLLGRLAYPLDRLLEQHAPETIDVPSGSRMKLDYTAGAAPVLAVRLQEVFGWADTPRVAGGRVPVLLHLLGPNYRPVQITSDLAGFWSTLYFQVRKDLRARYPKHSWPDDPLSATAIAKGRSTRR